MKFKFIGNAAGIFTGSKGTKILCDPWIIDGVFEGSWYQYPPLKTKISDLQEVDAIYVSHIHPDHYDERYFDFPKEIPLIVLDEGPNFLIKNLIKKGYSNFIKIKNDETKKFNEFSLTIYKPFTEHIYEESLIGNLIDSALVLKDKKITAINFNDNTPSKDACIKLKKKFNKINLAMLNYNTAGPYPSCFDNLNKDEKIIEKNKILKRNFDYLCDIIPILKPNNVIPFAGSYILGGKNSNKNQYLATTTWDVCADYLKKNLKTESKIICLRENQTFDIEKEINLEKYEKINIQEMSKYIEKIKNHKYEYELDVSPDIEILKKDIKVAKNKLNERIKKFKINIKSNIFIKLGKEKIQVIEGSEKNRELICSMDFKLLRRILDRKSHWNNAEIGAHINFERSPNKMDVDAHTSLSFLHL